MLFYKIIIPSLFFISFSCGVSKKNMPSEEDSYTYLALGDSYTIGESVCRTCNYPTQLVDSLNQTATILPVGKHQKTTVRIIAKTGWTTTDLLAAIATENPSDDYDLVTLLIGVNNQYQGKPFSVYKKEFPELLDKAITFAKGKPENVIVLSIPDYAFTPFGQKSGKASTISKELDRYNAFAKKIAMEKDVYFENITPITRRGLKNPRLVASKDELHPSRIAYKKFVDMLFDRVSKIIY